MITDATHHKRQQLRRFIEQKLVPHSVVQAVVGVGSIASGRAHAGSDIDAVLFLDPLHLYIVPAESIWRAADDSFHSIFTEDTELHHTGLQLDFKRVDVQVWRAASYAWSEPMCAELASGWIAFDRTGDVTRLIAMRTAYDDTARIPRLDEAITWLDQHLGDDGPQVRWDTLSPAIAHDRLHAAYAYLVQALFAYNRQWRPWRNREMTTLLQLPWLPAHFGERVLVALNAPSNDYHGYLARATMLQHLFHDMLQQLITDGTYGANPVGEAFIRAHEEPGRAWNMDAWMVAHRTRYAQVQRE